MYKKLFCGVLITAVSLSGCGPASAEAEVVLTPVEASAVVKSGIKNELMYAGQIKPIDKVSVISKISGKVSEVYFDIGDAVAEGDVLFKLDEEDLQNQIKQLESQVNMADQTVKSAQTALRTVTGGQYESQLLQQETQIENADKQYASAKLAVQNAEIGMENAKITHEKALVAISDTEAAFSTAETNYNNAKTLYEAGVMSENDFDRVDAGYQQTKNALDQARLALDQASLMQIQAEVAYNQALVQEAQAETGFKAAQDAYSLTQGRITSDNRAQAQTGVSTAQASRESAQIQLDIVRESLEDAAVKSPLTGVVSAKNAIPGEFVSPQLPAFTIVNYDTVSVEVSVSEILINTISAGQEVDVYINTLGAEPFKGTIMAVSPAADNTSTYPVKINIANPDGAIKPGMFAEIRFILEQSQDTIVLPRNVVLEDESGRYVYVSENGAAKKTVVTTGIDNGKEIEILTGLEVGDEIIVKGHTYVVDGEAVNMVSLTTSSVKEEAQE